MIREPLVPPKGPPPANASCRETFDNTTRDNQLSRRRLSDLAAGARDPPSPMREGSTCTCTQARIRKDGQQLNPCCLQQAQITCRSAQVAKCVEQEKSEHTQQDKCVFCTRVPATRRPSVQHYDGYAHPRKTRIGLRVDSGSLLGPYSSKRFFASSEVSPCGLACGGQRCKHIVADSWGNQVQHTAGTRRTGGHTHAYTGVSNQQDTQEHQRRYDKGSAADAFAAFA